MKINKKLTGSIIIVLIIILLIVAGIYIYNSRKIERRDISKLTFKEGTSSVNSAYTLEKVGKMDFKYFNSGNQQQTKIQLTNEQYSNIENMISKYELNKWNGFKVHDDSEGGSYFNIFIEYTNGNVLNAEGTNNFPINYFDFQKEFQEFADNLSKINAFDV